MKNLFLLTALVLWTTGCAADMVNLDPKFQDIDNSIAQNEANLTALADDYTIFKSSINAVLNSFNQTILDFMPPGFVLCVISSDTAFNWEVKYGTGGVKVTEIIP